MRTFVGLLFTVIALNCALAGPVHSPNDDAEIVDVPRRGGATRNDEDTPWDVNTNGFRGVISTNVGYPFLQPAPEVANPLFRLGYADAFEDLFRRLHTRVFPIGLGFGDEEDGADDTTGVVDPFGFGISDTKPKNGTTSTVKIVGGHKVEINETSYGDDNAVFKVRVVNIRPADSDEDVKPTETENPDTKKTEEGEVNPVTSGPKIKEPEANPEAKDDRRESLEKNDTDNEVRDLNTDNNEVNKY